MSSLNLQSYNNRMKMEIGIVRHGLTRSISITKKTRCAGNSHTLILCSNLVKDVFISRSFPFFVSTFGKICSTRLSNKGVSEFKIDEIYLATCHILPSTSFSEICSLNLIQYCQ